MTDIQKTIETLAEANRMLREELEEMRRRQSEPVEAIVARYEHSEKVRHLEDEVYRLQRENYFLQQGIKKEEMHKYLKNLHHGIQ